MARACVRDVQLLAVDPPGDVIDAFNEVQRARQDRDRLKNEAKPSERHRAAARAAAKLVAEAEAYRAEVVNRAAGDASRLTRSSGHQANPDVTKERIYIETVGKSSPTWKNHHRRACWWRRRCAVSAAS